MATPDSHQKKALRAYYKGLRLALTSAQTSQMNHQMLSQFLKIPLQGKNYKYALSYKPIAQANEVDTALFDSYLQNELQPAVQIAYPRTDFITLEMEAVLPDPATTFTPKWQILNEPTAGKLLEPTHVDIILLPLLIFDQKGNRIGYGKGFYDRYLSRCRPDTLKIGLSYLPPVPQIEDVGDFDIPLDYCATPERLYDFRQQ